MHSSTNPATIFFVTALILLAGLMALVWTTPFAIAQEGASEMVEQRSLKIADVSLDAVTTRFEEDGSRTVMFGVTSKMGNVEGVRYGILLRGEGGVVVHVERTEETIDLIEGVRKEVRFSYTYPENIVGSTTAYLMLENDAGLVLSVEEIGTTEGSKAERGPCSLTGVSVSCPDVDSVEVRVYANSALGDVVSTQTFGVPFKKTFDEILADAFPGKYTIQFSATHQGVAKTVFFDTVKSGQSGQIQSMSSVYANSALKVTYFLDYQGTEENTPLSLKLKAISAEGVVCGELTHNTLGTAGTVELPVTCSMGTLQASFFLGDTEVDTFEGSFGKEEDEGVLLAGGDGTNFIPHIVITLILLLLLIFVGRRMSESGQKIPTALFTLALAAGFFYSENITHAATYAIGGTVLQYQGCISGSWTNGTDMSTCPEPGIWINAYRPTGSVTVPDTATTGASYSVTISQSMSSYAGQAGVPARTYCNDGGADYVCGPNNIAAVFYRNLPAPSGAPYNSLPSASVPGAVTIPGTATLLRTVEYPSPNQTFSLTAPSSGVVDRLGIIQRPDAVSYVRCGIDVASARENCWTYQWGYSSVDVTLVPAPLAPLTPTGLTVNTSAQCGGRINISWNASSGATSYQLSRDGGAWFSVGNVTSYTDIALTPTQSYAYRVRAVNGVGNSVASAAQSDTASGWCYQDLGCEGYTQCYPCTTCFIDDFTAPPGTRLEIRLPTGSQLLCGSPYMRTVADAACSTPPATPTGLSTTPGNCGSGQILLNWNSVSGATSYTVRRGATVVATTTGTTLTDSGLTAGQTYNYTVRANGFAGNSVYSTAVPGTAPSACITVDLVPGTPVRGVTSVSQGGSINFTLAVQNTGTGPAVPHANSVIEIDRDGNGTVDYSGGTAITGQTVNTAAGTTYNRSTTWSVPVAAATGTNYRARYRVDTGFQVAEGVAGEANNVSPWSLAFTVTVPNTPPTVTAGADRTITLPVSTVAASGASAADPNGISSTLWAAISNPGITPIISAGNTLTPTFSGMSLAGNYVFRLTATDSLGAASNDTMTVIVNPTAVYACTGAIPANAAAWDAEESSSLAANTPWTQSVSDTATKCEFRCNATYWWNGTSCVQPDLSSQNTAPAAGASYTTAQSITFNGNAINSAAAPVTQGGWADLEIDLNGDNTVDLNYNAYGTVRLGAFAQSQVKSLTYNVSAGTLPVGNHRYRFHVDTDGTGVVESNETTNNTAPWIGFTVSTAAVPVNGVCGTNARAYTSGETVYAGTFCNAGTVSPASPVFPAQGGSTNWQCLGLNGGTNAACAATRASAPPTATGDIVVTSCQIALNQSTCTVPVSWTTTSASNPRVEQNGTQFSTAANNPGTTRSASNGNNILSLFDGAALLDAVSLNIGCASGTAWDGLACVTTILPPVLTADNLIVRQNTSVELDWNTNNGNEALCTLVGSGLPGTIPTNNGDAQTGSIDVIISGRTTYELRCPHGQDMIVVDVTPDESES